MGSRTYTSEGLRVFTLEDALRYGAEQNYYTVKGRGSDYWFEKLREILKKNEIFADYMCTLAQAIIKDWHYNYSKKDELSINMFTFGFIMPYHALGGLEEKNFPIVSREVIDSSARKDMEAMAIGGKEALARIEENQICDMKGENGLLLYLVTCSLEEVYKNSGFITRGRGFSAITYNLIKLQAIKDKIGNLYKYKDRGNFQSLS